MTLFIIFQSVRLVSVLESRLNESRVWVIMQSRGITYDTLVKKWKRKAYYLLGKAYVGMMELKLAKDSFKSALTIIQSDSSLAKEATEIKQLLASTTKKLEKETKNAKKMWSKAFQQNSGIEGDIERAMSPDTPSRSQPSPSQASSSSSSPMPNSQQGTGTFPFGSVASGGSGSGGILSPDDIDLSQFGIGPSKKKNTISTTSGTSSSSAVAKKSKKGGGSDSSSSLVMGGVFALLTVGLIGGFAFMRYRK